MTIAPDILHELTDVLRLRNGQSLTVRFVEPQDIASLSDYFHALSRRSNYNRFLGAMHDLPAREIATILATGEANRFAVIGEVAVDGVPRIVAGSCQLLVGPASISRSEQMNVRLSTRATSRGSEAA